MLNRPAVFLDRDGTLLEEAGYLDRLERLVFFPYSVDAVRLLNRSGFAVVVVTNQAGIARGIFKEAFVAEAHRHISQAARRSAVRASTGSTIVRIIRRRSFRRYGRIATAASRSRGCSPGPLSSSASTSPGPSSSAIAGTISRPGSRSAPAAILVRTGLWPDRGGRAKGRRPARGDYRQRDRSRLLDPPR